MDVRRLSEDNDSEILQEEKNQTARKKEAAVSRLIYWANYIVKKARERGPRKKP